MGTNKIGASLKKFLSITREKIIPGINSEINKVIYTFPPMETSNLHS